MCVCVCVYVVSYTNKYMYLCCQTNNIIRSREVKIEYFINICRCFELRPVSLPVEQRIKKPFSNETVSTCESLTWDHPGSTPDESPCCFATEPHSLEHSGPLMPGSTASRV